VDPDANTVTVRDVAAFSPWLLFASSPPQAVSGLAGSRSENDLVLSWPAVTQDIRGRAVTPDHYVVYRADEPYFIPGPSDVLATPTSPSYTDRGVLADPAQRHYYVVTAVDRWGLESASSSRIGALAFPMVPPGPAGQPTYSPLALSLALPGVTDADTLAAYVGDAVAKVLQHHAPTQSIEERVPGQDGPNFQVETGDALLIYLEDTAPGVLSLVGEVPSKDEVRFTLTRPEPGHSCAYNYISVPLHRDDLTSADALAADMGGVYSVGRYNAETQDLTWRLPGQVGENFGLQAGHPYLVCLAQSAPASWP
jgi:hypothetical protein